MQGSLPSGSSPRHTRMNELAFHSRATVVGSVCPGRMIVSGGSSISVPMIES